ncbi:hypothetical protein BC830DRAFT_1085842 [Chytriomyces sp. MP71]|nr:hypothetical protein BC830DRAFT_1085842 [Chytriomyces sp. MP71]
MREMKLNGTRLTGDEFAFSPENSSSSGICQLEMGLLGVARHPPNFRSVVFMKQAQQREIITRTREYHDSTMTVSSKIDELMRELDMTLDDCDINDVLDDYFGSTPQIKVPHGPLSRNSHLAFIESESADRMSYVAFAENDKALPIPPASPSASQVPGSPVRVSPAHELFLKQQQQLIFQQQLILQQQQQMQALEQQAQLVHTTLYFTTRPESLSLKTPTSTTLSNPIPSTPDLARNASQSTRASHGTASETRTPDLARVPSQICSSSWRMQDGYEATRRQSFVSLGSGLGISGGVVLERGEGESLRTSPVPATGRGLSALFGFRGKAGSPTQKKGSDSFTQGMASAGLF